MEEVVNVGPTCSCFIVRDGRTSPVSITLEILPVSLPISLPSTGACDVLVDDLQCELRERFSRVH